MFNSPLEILCSPILIPQGLYTKWTTPRLQEAEGKRMGQIGSGKPLRLLITGDSAAAGVGAHLQTEALSGQLAHVLKRDYDCSWALYAQSGFSTAQLNHYLDHLPMQDFDIAVVSIGVNDVTKPLSISRWKKQIQFLHRILRDKFSVKFVIYTAIPPMHEFPALPNPLRYFLGKTAKKMNVELATLFEARPDSTVLNIKLPFETQFIARDGFHPSPKAYELWAAHTAKLIDLHYSLSAY